MSTEKHVGHEQQAESIPETVRGALQRKALVIVEAAKCPKCEKVFAPSRPACDICSIPTTPLILYKRLLRERIAFAVTAIIVLYILTIGSFLLSGFKPEMLIFPPLLVGAFYFFAADMFGMRFAITYTAETIPDWAFQKFTLWRYLYELPIVVLFLLAMWLIHLAISNTTGK